MMFTDDDLNRIQAFFTPLENKIAVLEKRIDERFDTIDQYFDALFKRDETSEQEYIAVKE